MRPWSPVWSNSPRLQQNPQSTHNSSFSAGGVEEACDGEPRAKVVEFGGASKRGDPSQHPEAGEKRAPNSSYRGQRVSNHCVMSRSSVHAHATLDLNPLLQCSSGQRRMPMNSNFFVPRRFCFPVGFVSQSGSKLVDKSTTNSGAWPCGQDHASPCKQEERPRRYDNAQPKDGRTKRPIIRPVRQVQQPTRTVVCKQRHGYRYRATNTGKEKSGGI